MKNLVPLVCLIVGLAGAIYAIVETTIADRQVSDLEQRIVTLQGQLAPVDQELYGLERALYGVSGASPLAWDDIGAINEDIAALQSSLPRLEGDLYGVQTDLEEAEWRRSCLRSDLDNLVEALYGSYFGIDASAFNIWGDGDIAMIKRKLGIPF